MFQPIGTTNAQWNTEHYDVIIGNNDLKRMKKLSRAGNDHGKFLRMINVTIDIVAPLYWWKEFDTYKVERLQIVVVQCTRYRRKNSHLMILVMNIYWI